MCFFLLLLTPAGHTHRHTHTYTGRGEVSVTDRWTCRTGCTFLSQTAPTDVFCFKLLMKTNGLSAT